MDVSVLRVKDYSAQEIKHGVSQSLDYFGVKDDLKGVNSVLIKPNLCYYWDYSTGETTDPRFVSCIIEYIRLHHPDINITIGEADASAMRTRHAYKILGYEKISKEYCVPLINLSDGTWVSEKVSINGIDLDLPISKTFSHFDYIINVPKLKTHPSTGMTCSMKNIYGAIAKPYKFPYHKNLAEVIVGINEIIHTDINIVDGIICRGKYPKKIGIILTGRDAFKTDLIAAKLMGFNPAEIKYLKLKLDLLNRKRFPEISIHEVNICIDDVIRDFPKVSHTQEIVMRNVLIPLIKLYAKVSGDQAPFEI